MRDWGERILDSYFSPSVFAYGESTSLIRGRQGGTMWASSPTTLRENAVQSLGIYREKEVKG